jgi:hypothetical protein
MRAAGWRVRDRAGSPPRYQYIDHANAGIDLEQFAAGRHHCGNRWEANRGVLSGESLNILSDSNEHSEGADLFPKLI